jgi:hypothetical protein
MYSEAQSTGTITWYQKTNGGSTARFYRVDLNDFYKKALGGNFTLNRFEGRR